MEYSKYIVKNSFIYHLTHKHLLISKYKNYVYQTEYIHNNDNDTQDTHDYNDITNLFVIHKYNHFFNYEINYENAHIFFEKYFNYIHNLKTHNILLDFFGVNLGKLIHFGHIRSLLIGITLHNILKALNQKIRTDTHYGDYGVNMAIFINYFIKSKDIHITNINIFQLHKIYMKYRDDTYMCATNVLQNIQSHYYKYYKHIQNVSLVYIHNIMNIFRFVPDLELSEYSYYNLCLFLEQYFIREKYAHYEVNNKRLITKNGIVLTRNNGVHIYASTDIAAIFEREKMYNFTHIFYIIDDRQRDHFKLIFEFCNILNFTSYKEHIRYGEVSDINGVIYKSRHNMFDILQYIQNLKDKFNIHNDNVIIISFMLYEMRHNTHSLYALNDDIIYDYIVKVYTFIEIIYNDNTTKSNEYSNEEKILINDFIRLSESIIVVANTRNIHYIYSYIFNIINTTIKIKIFSHKFKYIFDKYLLNILRIVLHLL